MTSAWRKIFFSFVLGKITDNPDFESEINGMSISPKKNFLILKIWLKSCKYDSPENIYPIEGLMAKHCIFKKHVS